jgi:hypothetical protein
VRVVLYLVPHYRLLVSASDGSGAILKPLRREDVWGVVRGGGEEETREWV